MEYRKECNATVLAYYDSVCILFIYLSSNLLFIRCHGVHLLSPPLMMSLMPPSFHTTLLLDSDTHAGVKLRLKYAQNLGILHHWQWRLGRRSSTTPILSFAIYLTFCHFCPLKINTITIEIFFFDWFSLLILFNSHLSCFCFFFLSALLLGIPVQNAVSFFFLSLYFELYLNYKLSLSHNNEIRCLNKSEQFWNLNQDFQGCAHATGICTSLEVLI